MPVKIGQPIGAPQDFATFDPNTLLTAPARSEPTQSVGAGDYKISYAKAAPTNAVPALNPINGEWTPEVIASQNARADEFNPPTESALRERSYNEALTPFFQESQGPRRLTEAELRASQTPRVEAFEPKTFTGEIGKGNIPGAIGVAYKATRESLSPFFGPTEEQFNNEKVPWGTNPDGSVKYEYKPLGSRIDKTGLLMTPLLETKMMESEADDSSLDAAGKATFNFMAGLVNFGLSGLGIATVGLGGAVKATTRIAGGLGAEGAVAAETAARLAATARVVSGGFAIDMASAVPEQYKAATESPTLQGRIEGWLGTVSSLGFAALAAKHAAKKPLELAERQTIESVVELAKRTPDAVLETVARNMEVDVYSRNLAIAELQRRQTERQAALAPEAAAAAEAAGTALPSGTARPPAKPNAYDGIDSQAIQDALDGKNGTIPNPTDRASAITELERRQAKDTAAKTTEPPDPAATAVGVIKTAAAADAAGKPFSPRIEEPGTPTPYGRETDVYDITTGLQRKPAPVALEVAPPVAPKPESVVSQTVGTPIVGVGGSVISELQISRATYGAEIYNSMRAKDGTPPTRAEWEGAMAGEYPDIIEGGGAILTKTWQTSKAAAESFNANKGRKSMTDEATQVITGAIEGSGVSSRITNADQAASARQDMLPPAQRTIGPSTNLELMADVKREMQDNPYLMTELLNRVTADPRSKTSDREQVMLINYGNILRNQADALFASQKEAAKSGDKTLLRELAKEEEKLLERKKDFIQITVDSGSEAGKTLQARQIALAEDFTLLNRVAVEEIAKGAKLTREERAKVEKETSAHEKLTKAVAERDKAIAETAEQKYRANELEKLLSESGKKPAETVTKGRLPVDYAPKKPFGENVIAYADAKAAEALARIKAKIGGQLGSAPDPTILADAAIYGAAKLTKGSVKFTQWSLEMAAEVGNWIKPYAKELWEQSKVQVESMMSEAPRDIVAEREATLAGLKEATEANLPKSKLYGYARALAKQFIDEGMTKMGDIDAAVHAELQKVIPEITVRESGTAWTGYGEWKPASIEPASVTLANVTGERRAALKLEGVRDLDPPEARRNTGQGRQPPTAQTRMTEKEAARIEKQKNLKSVDPEKAHKTALESVKNNLRNRLEELKLAMATRKRINRDKIGVERDAEAKDLQDQLDVAQKDYDQVFPKEPITIDEQLRRSAVIAERNAAEWEKRASDAKKGIFKTSEKSDAPINQRIQAANDQAAAYRAEATRLRDLDSSISEAKTQAKLDLAGERLGDILDNGEKTKPSAKQGPVTAATSAKQARNAALRKAIEDSRDLSGETAAKRAEAIGRALDKEIAKVSNELETNTRRAAATGKVDTVGNEQKRSELAAMRDFRKELDKVAGKTIDEKTLDSLIKRRDVLQREVDSGKIDPKTGRPTANTAEQAKIQGEIDALNARKAQIRKAANPKTPENIRELQRIQDRLDSAKDRLARGQIEPETGKPTVRDKAQTDALAELKTINDTIAQLRRQAAPSLSSAMKNLRAERARIIRSIADKTLRIYGQEFEPRARPVKPVPFTPQEKALAEANMADRVELNRIENRLRQAAFDHALKNRTLPQKAADLLLETFGLARATMLSLDLGFMGLQLGTRLITNPLLVLKNMPAAIKAGWGGTGKGRGWERLTGSDRALDAVNKSIELRPESKNGDLKKMGIVTSTSALKTEYALRGRLADYLPVVAQSNRAMTAALNLVRADLARASIEAYGQGFPIDAKTLKMLGNEIKIVTGSGALGKAEMHRAMLNHFGLAPGWVISRFQFLYGQPVWEALLKGDKKAAGMFFRSYVKWAAGSLTLLSAAAFFHGDDWDEFKARLDPRSSRFGMIPIGNRIYDFSSGIIGPLVFLSRFITGERVTKDGEVISLRREDGEPRKFGTKSTTDLAFKFAQGKAAPIPGFILDLASGEDVVGRPANFATALLNRTLPLTPRQMAQIASEEGIPGSVIPALLQFMGVNSRNEDIGIEEGMDYDPVFQIADKLGADPR